MRNICIILLISNTTDTGTSLLSHQTNLLLLCHMQQDEFRICTDKLQEGGGARSPPRVITTTQMCFAEVTVRSYSAEVTVHVTDKVLRLFADITNENPKFKV